MGLVKVVDLANNSLVEFKCLKVGETFRYGGEIFLKTRHDGLYNVFSFNRNQDDSFGRDTLVAPVNSKIVIEN